MNRLKENRIVIDEMNKRAERNPVGTYDEMVVFQLGVIATMLADISKSLAIFADKAETEQVGNPDRLKEGDADET